MQLDTDMSNAIAGYLAHIQKDFDLWRTGCSYPEESLNLNLNIDTGSTYIKIMEHGSRVHSFIVAKDKGKFRRGDILKAASWKAPAKNFIRGNIFDSLSYEKRVRWTGAS